jgi:hypothetical protein
LPPGLHQPLLLVVALLHQKPAQEQHPLLPPSLRRSRISRIYKF